ncbi:M6 family metalloprotease domain-containing protein [Xylanibacter muris]|uniref:M6 family metalloprotease domain-containing protein n=1 Tax=Xylanibacter muris TaxID=2736290 RepID=A0ABX2AM25_9BACT|nr:M6 family metalloprotease domain-containing protein [Xylanibacter muris]NPD91255.1 M6 family metalloprotease domain-containing protein [Xylanibacter muris]
MKYLMTFIFIFTSAIGWAVKMKPGATKVRQADGTTITIKGFGDEDFHYLTTTDGVLLVQESKGYFIAKVDDNGMLASTGVLAHDIHQRNIEEKELILLQDKQLFAEKLNGNREKRRIMREPVENNPTLFPHTGNPKVPVLLVQFSDVPFSVSDPKNTFNKYLNAEALFDKNTDKDMGRNYGSVKKYFSDMSHGKFTPQFDVYGPIQLEKPMSYYGRTENMTALFSDACAAAENMADFTQYDSNNDGNIDLIYIIYAGFSESIAGNSEDCIYPKSGTLYGISIDGKGVCRYGVNNELNGTPEDQANGPLINGIGLFCHEFSHCMGLPDLYPTPGSLAERSIDHNLDYWDLMDAGEYTFNGYRPTEYSAWEREAFGWTTIDTLKISCDITLSTLADNGKAYKIINDNDPSGNEYYIVENVQQQGWNRYLFGHGMLVYHIDYKADRFSLGGCKVNSELGHPRMTLIAADGTFIPEYFIAENIVESDDDFLKSWNKPLYDKYGGQTFSNNMYKAEAAGDPYPGTSGNTELTDNTQPKAWVYTGEGMSKAITAISEDVENGTVSFKFMNGGVGIESTTNDSQNQDNTIFSLSGVRMDNNVRQLPKGIYIRNSKVFVK